MTLERDTDGLLIARDSRGWRIRPGARVRVTVSCSGASYLADVVGFDEFAGRIIVHVKHKRTRAMHATYPERCEVRPKGRPQKYRGWE